MAGQTGFIMDFSVFALKFGQITKEEIPNNAAESMYEEWPYILADAIEKEPKCPVKTGFLSKSQGINKPIRPGGGGNITVSGGFTAKYAAKVHEMPESTNWSEPLSGPKFLEAKLIMYAQEYLESIAKRMQSKIK